MRRLLAFALLAAAGCSRAPREAPPAAEFLLASADSTFWVAASGGEIHVRGAPITLARYDGKFYELYTADDDFSYDDALLVGERLYRRDIASGDSLVLFADTAVARIALSYAHAHPNLRPLAPGEEGEADPATTATSQVDVLGIYGPYLTYEYHVDVALPGSRPWHSTRRGVLDLRTGSAATVADLFGADTARLLAERGRHTYEAARDSILAERAATRGDDRRAADALSSMQFDERSFSLSALDGRPAVSFDIPGRGEGPAGNVIELDPAPVSPTAWWKGVASGLPVGTDEGDDRWPHGAYTVLARYDTSGELARVTLHDSARREWPVASILGPLRDIIWLDQPPIGAADRAALRRAFNSAASYDETSRVAALPSVVIPVAHRPSPITYASRQDCPRKPARNLRADDARACQQHGARVRRRRSLDDGQDRGDRRLSAQPRQRRDGVDRPRRLPPAHSSRRPADHEGQRQLRGTFVHGSRGAR